MARENDLATWLVSERERTGLRGLRFASTGRYLVEVPAGPGGSKPVVPKEYEVHPRPRSPWLQPWLPNVPQPATENGRSRTRPRHRRSTSYPTSPAISSLPLTPPRLRSPRPSKPA